MERTQVYLNESHKRILKHMAIDRDTSISHLIRDAISIYIIEQSGTSKKYVTKKFNQSLSGEGDSDE